MVPFWGTTLIINNLQRGTALGLAYSSTESLKLAINEMKGTSYLTGLRLIEATPVPIIINDNQGSTIHAIGEFGAKERRAALCKG